MTTSLLRISSGGTVINFSAGDDIRLMQYKPVVTASQGKNVEDQARIGFVGSSTVNKANFNGVNQLLEQARNFRRTETGSRVYLEYDPDSSGTYYRSMVVDGYIELVEDTIGSTWETAYIYGILHITREPFWEGALTQVPLSNASASGNTSGITITNAYDSTAENFVDVDSADVIGDLPAPIKLQLEHTKSGADACKEFYTWHNVYSNPSAFDHVLEAEDATGATVTDSGADTTSSEDMYATLAWTATTETLIATWALSNTLVTNAAGGRFAVLARWRGLFPYTNAWIRLKLMTANDKVLWSGNLSIVSSTRELALLDVLRIPPYLAGQASIKDLQLKMYGYRNQSGTHSIPLDYLQLSPISGDSGWKRFLSVDDGAAYQEFLTHDDIENFTYRTDTSAKLISEFSDYGGPIHLVPNKDQRLYFNTCDKDGEAKVDQTWKVKLWYRPRRSVL